MNMEALKCTNVRGGDQCPKIDKVTTALFIVCYVNVLGNIKVIQNVFDKEKRRRRKTSAKCCCRS